MKPSYEELEAQCAALAAENAGLKKSEPAPFSKLMMEALDVYQAGADEVPELAMLSAYKKLRDGLKTPATDAFLAEVRAQHLQSYADCIAARMKDKSLSMRQKELLNFAWAEVKSYAAELHNAQLRKGVQS